MSDKPAKPEDFYATLLNYVDEKQFPQALNILSDLENERRQLGALSRIALDLETDQSLNLDLSLAVFLDLTRARDLARSIARELARSISHDLEIAQDLLAILVRVLGRCQRQIANDKLEAELKRVQNRAQFLDHAIQALFASVPAESEAHAPANDSPAGVVKFTGLEVLSVQSLQEIILPYLQAMVAVQGVIDALKGQPMTELHFQIIGKGHLQVAGAQMPEAINVIRELIKVRVAADYHLRPNTHEGHHPGAATEAAAIALKAPTHINGFEANREAGAFEQHKLIVEKANRIIQKLTPELPEAERIYYTARLIQPIEVLMHSPVQLYG